ncbi:MAG: hypothetical protein V4661_00160 [Pseudomonadota bacterium]
MTKSISVNKNSRGRPKKPGGVDPVMATRFPAELRGAIVKWAENQPDLPKISEAVRRLVEIGLTVKAPARHSSDKQKARAKELAGSAIDKLTVAASSDEKATSKRRLIQGPSSFRDARVDRPKRKT